MPVAATGAPKTLEAPPGFSTDMAPNPAPGPPSDMDVGNAASPENPDDVPVDNDITGPLPPNDANGVDKAAGAVVAAGGVEAAAAAVAEVEELVVGRALLKPLNAVLKPPKPPPVNAPPSIDDAGVGVVVAAGAGVALLALEADAGDAGVAPDAVMTKSCKGRHMSIKRLRQGKTTSARHTKFIDTSTATGPHRKS